METNKTMKMHWKEKLKKLEIKEKKIQNTGSYKAWSGNINSNR
jgi:hypothetical protein